MKYVLYAVCSCEIYIGEFEGEDKEDAIENAWNLGFDLDYTQLNYGDFTINKLVAEEVE